MACRVQGLTMLGLVAGSVALAHPAAAQSTTIARWVQYAPGSSNTALAAGTWGDQPSSLASTVLVRAVVTAATSCPGSASSAVR